MITRRTGCVSFSPPNGTQHSSYELAYFIKSRDVRHQIALFSGLLKICVNIRCPFWEVFNQNFVSAARLREVSALERIQLQGPSAMRQGPNLLSVFRELVSALGSERVDCKTIFKRLQSWSKVYGTPWKFAMFSWSPPVRWWKRLFFSNLDLPPYNVASRGTLSAHWPNIVWGEGGRNGEIVKKGPVYHDFWPGL